MCFKNRHGEEGGLVEEKGRLEREGGSEGYVAGGWGCLGVKVKRRGDLQCTRLHKRRNG